MDSPCLRRLHWSSGAVALGLGGHALALPFYKKEEGWCLFVITFFLPFLLGILLPLAMVRGCAGALMAATRASARQRAPLPLNTVASELATRGGGRGEVVAVVVPGAEEVAVVLCVGFRAP